MITRLLAALLLFIALFWSSAAGQQTSGITLDSYDVPFEMVKNAIVIPVKVNDVQFRFVLDTGGMFMISKRVKNQGDFTVTDAVTISDASGEEKDFERVRVEKTSIGRLNIHGMEAIVSFDSDAYPNSCFGTDGMIGRDFFKGMILHINYKKGIIRLTQDRTALNLDSHHRTALRISDRGLPDVLLSINGKDEYIEFDSGSGDFFSYKTETAEHLPVREASDKLRFDGIFSFGVSSREQIQSTSRYRVYIDELILGATSFTDFYSDLSKPSAPRIGAGILYHGDVTIDYNDQWFYYKPYTNESTLSPLRSFGFDIAYLNGEYIIKWVLEGSDAEKHGLSYGQKLTSINGVLVDEAAAGCDGYINGYSFHQNETVSLKYTGTDGEIRSLTLKNKTFE